MPTYTALKGVRHFGESLLLEQIEVNLQQYFTWGLLGVGAFFNYDIPASGAYGGDFAGLQCLRVPGYTDGVVWQAARSDWVWEQDIEYDYQPIHPSGYVIDGDFYTIGTSGTYFNFPDGRLYSPNNPISTSSTVQVAHSSRWVQSHVSLGMSDSFKKIQYNSFRPDDSHFQGTIASGIWHLSANDRLQLPAIIFSANPLFNSRGAQLGGGQITYQDVDAWVFAENKWEWLRICDVLRYAKDKRIHMFDYDNIPSALDYRGMVASGALTYPNLVVASGDYFYNKMTFFDVRGTDIFQENPLYSSVVTLTMEVELPDLT